MYDKSDLERDLKRWLFGQEAEEKRIVEGTQSFLGPGGLVPSRVSMWKHRGSPPTAFVEGAALLHVARSRDVDHWTAVRLGFIAEQFFQVFVVDEKPQGKSHGCLGIRLWSGVKRYGQEKSCFTHKTWFDGSLSPHEGGRGWPRDIETGEPIEHTESGFREKGHIWELNIPSDSEGKSDKAALTWKVKDNAADYGYFIYMKEAINSYAETRSYDYLGGTCSIPTRSEVILVVLPNEILAPPRGLLRTAPNPQQCIGFPLDDFLGTVDKFIKGELPERYESSLDTGPNVGLWKDSEIEPPMAVLKLLKNEDVMKDQVFTEDEIRMKSKERHTIFLIDILSPAVAFNYCLFFQLRDKPSGGVDA